MPCRDAFLQNAIQTKTQAELDRAGRAHASAPVWTALALRRTALQACAAVQLARAPSSPCCGTHAGSAPCTVTSVHSSYCEAW